MPKSRFIRPKIFLSFKTLVAVESTRHGGVSPHPYASLNLGMHTDDLPENVKQNRSLFFEELGFDEKALAASFQVHGNDILLATKPGQYHGYDALITNRPGLFLSVRTADCVPILIFDPERNVIGAIHAGWRGTVKRIIEKAFLAMNENFGTQPSDCLSYVGTCIDECDFEVDADVADHFESEFKRWDGVKQKFFIDLKQANRNQLLESGVPENQIEVSPFSTGQHNEDFFSHRKEKGITGRMMAIIGLKEG